jgi:PAS domain S-box-containing protein
MKKDTAEQPFVLTYPDGRIMNCNQAFCELTGYVEEELRNMRWDLDLTPQEWRKADSNQIGELYLTGEPRTFVKEYIRKDGSRIKVELFRQLVQDGDGNVRYYHNFVTEIPEGQSLKTVPWKRKRAHFTLMGSLPGIAYRCVYDREWTMKWIVGGCYELTGYHATDLINNKKISWNYLIHPEDRERVWDVAMIDFKEGRPFQQEYRIITASGAEKWIWEQCRGIKTYKGEESIEGFITDVTERKLAEEQIKTALANQDTMIKEISDIDSRIVTSLVGIQSQLREDGHEQTALELEKCIKSLIETQSKLYQTKRIASIDFAGYTQLARDVEFIFNGREYLYLK